MFLGIRPRFLPTYHLHPNAARSVRLEPDVGSGPSSTERNPWTLGFDFGIDRGRAFYLRNWGSKASVKWANSRVQIVAVMSTTAASPAGDQ